MEAEKLAAIGRAIYGDRWQLPLADNLGLDPETIRRWLADHPDLSEDHGVVIELGGGVDEKRALLNYALQILRERS